MGAKCLGVSKDTLRLLGLQMAPWGFGAIKWHTGVIGESKAIERQMAVIKDHEESEVWASNGRPLRSVYQRSQAPKDLHPFNLVLQHSR